MCADTLRVLHVSTWNIRCGIASYCKNLIKGLDRRSIVSDVYPIQPHDWLFYQKCDEERVAQEIADKARDFDLVHFQHEHGLYGQARGSVYALKRFGQILTKLKSQNTPSVTTFHTEPIHNGHKKPKFYRKPAAYLRNLQWQRLVGKHFHEKSGACEAIVHSELTRFRFVRAGLSHSSTHVIPHACMPQRQATMEMQEAKRQLGISPDTCLLTIFGFLGAYKGHNLAIEALKYLPEHFQLAIVGGAHPESCDNYLSKLLEQIENGFRHRVVITGYVEEDVANRFYAASDICLAPYARKTNLSASGAITWALSSGRPTIASKIDAFQAIQRESDSMLMVTPEEPQELAWACECLATDESMRAKLVANAGEYCRKHSWDSTSESIIRIYERVLEKHRGSTIASKPLSIHKAA